MSKSSPVYSRLKKKANDLSREKVVDVFLFGSFVKGKNNPQDIDICIVFREKVDLSIVRTFEEKSTHVSFLTADNFFTKKHNLAKTILNEGISLLTGESFSSRFGMESKVIYYYDISRMKESDKVRFVYLMKGRNGKKGFIEANGGKFIAPGCFVIPISKDKEILEVMKVWKVKYERQILWTA